MSIAIVTGASSGIGSEYCRQLDGRGLDCIWLVARRKDAMESIASGLKTPTRVFSVDLSDRTALDAFCDIVRQESPEIKYLINSAGFGSFGMSWEMPIDHTRSMIDVNVVAMVTVTCACVPFMIKGSHIITLASEAGYIGLYDFNCYGSTKAYVRYFCTGLRKELEPRSVSVTEVSPGFVRTEFIDNCQTIENGPKKCFKNSVSKEDVVSQSLAAAEKGKRRSICGFKNKFIIFMAQHFPNFASNYWMTYFR